MRINQSAFQKLQRPTVVFVKPFFVFKTCLNLLG